jgi:hypothetical protein
MVFLSSTLSKRSRRNVTWVCGVVRAHERYKFWWTVHGVPSFLNIRQFGGFKIGADPQHGAPSFCCLNSNLKDMMVALSVFSKKTTVATNVFASLDSSKIHPELTHGSFGRSRLSNINSVLLLLLTFSPLHTYTPHQHHNVQKKRWGRRMSVLLPTLLKSTGDSSCLLLALRAFSVYKYCVAAAFLPPNTRSILFLTPR